jgi:hypothetical protein
LDISEIEHPKLRLDVFDTKPTSGAKPNGATAVVVGQEYSDNEATPSQEAGFGTPQVEEETHNGCIDIPTDKEHDVQLAKKKINKASSLLLRFNKPQVLLN